MHRKTPRKARSSEKEPVEVFCRIKPVDNGVKCIKVIDTKTILVTHPDLLAIGHCPAPANCKEIQYEFRQIFDEKCSQKDVFDRVAFPLVRGLINGCNGLLFTYGVTGSGKTFTMNGNPKDGGILPRTLDVLFNSISNVQARKFIFKPDRLNGFDVQTEVEAKVDFQRELLQQNKLPKTPRRVPSDGNLSDRVPDLARVKEIDEDCLYSVFVSHIEIYNNHIYDLLDDVLGDGRVKNPQSKILREDSNRNMFVHGVNEVEVTSTEEAFEIFYKGQKRKRMAHTCLNAESSRSHSVFTLRLVQAPLNCKGDDIIPEKNIVSVSQLSMVDLAGSERTNRTNNSGQRLREAGNINNSLMTLRTCFELLRENQANGTSKVVPYRQSRLTHLFKSNFDGDGLVKMIVCVNPKADDYDETVHVLKFAEMSQEIHVTRPNPVRHDLGFTPGRRKANNARIENCNNKNVISHDLGVVYSLGPAFPPMEPIKPENGDAIKSLITFLQMRQEKRSILLNELLNKQQVFRNKLMKVETESVLARQEVMTIKSTLEMERKKNSAVENKYVDLESCCSDLEFKIHEKNEEILALKNELEEVKASLSQKVLEKEKEKQRIRQKMLQDKQKASKDIQQKQKELRNEFMTQMRVKDEKLRLVKEIIASESLNVPPPGNVTPSSSEGDLPTAASAKTSKSTNIPPISWALPADQPPGTPGASSGMNTDRPVLRHRRSKSASNTSGVWLAHCPVVSAVPLSTVLQPKMNKKKSVSQLTDIKDLSNSKTSKYCLTTQEADSGGEIETRLYKGDVVNTNGGGCQVVFNDVETLKQVSPTRISTKRRSGEEIARIIAMHDDAAGRAQISHESHGKKPRN